MTPALLQRAAPARLAPAQHSSRGRLGCVARATRRPYQPTVTETSQLPARRDFLILSITSGIAAAIRAPPADAADETSRESQSVEFFVRKGPDEPASNQYGASMYSFLFSSDNLFHNVTFF